METETKRDDILCLIEDIKNRVKQIDQLQSEIYIRLRNITGLLRREEAEETLIRG